MPKPLIVNRNACRRSGDMVAVELFASTARGDDATIVQVIDALTTGTLGVSRLVRESNGTLYEVVLVTVGADAVESDRSKLSREIDETRCANDKPGNAFRLPVNSDRLRRTCITSSCHPRKGVDKAGGRRRVVSDRAELSSAR